MRRRHHLRCAPRGASLLEAVDVTESPADGRHWLRRHHTMPCEYGVPTPLSRWPSCVASLPEAVVTNSVQELEPGAMALFPDVLTVGPLLSDKPVASFWAEDATCAAWLDAQPAGSVVDIQTRRYGVEFNA